MSIVLKSNDKAARLYLAEKNAKNPEVARKLNEQRKQLSNQTNGDYSDEKMEELLNSKPPQPAKPPQQSQSSFVPRKDSNKFSRINPKQPTPKQIKRAKRDAKKEAKKNPRTKAQKRGNLRRLLGLRGNNPTQNTGGRPNIFGRKPQAQSQPQAQTSNFDASQFVDDTLNQKPNVQNINQPNVAPAPRKRKLTRQEIQDRMKNPEFAQQVRSKNKKDAFANFRQASDTLSNISNVTLESIKNIKDPKVRMNVANNLKTQLERYTGQIGKANFDESEKLILKMKVNSIIKKLEE